MWTESPHSVCAYSNGLPVATRTPGARRSKSSAERTGATPSSARIGLIPSRKGRSNVAAVTVRMPASRILPGHPGRGRAPGPNGGEPGLSRYGMNGLNTSHGTPWREAADMAPQQLASMIVISGLMLPTAASMSATSMAARRTNTSTASRALRSALPVLHSRLCKDSMRGSRLCAAKPDRRHRSTPARSVRT